MDLINEGEAAVFDIDCIMITDIDGNLKKVNIDKKEFANIIYNASTSIEMDEFARSIHKSGKADLPECISSELLAIVKGTYKSRRMHEAMESYLNSLI